MNMVLDFKNVQLKGVISSSRAKHNVSAITKATNTELGEVTNTPCPAVNNGAIVSLNGKSKWTVTGTSYLTALNIAEGAVVEASSMTVDGQPAEIKAGSYKGIIVLEA